MIKKLIILLFLTITALSAALTFHLNQNMAKPVIITDNSFLTIKSGTSVSSFANQLTTKQWIDSPYWLKGYSRLYPERTKIKAGTYYIVKGTSLKQLLEQIVLGKEHQFSITFIEGTRFIDVLKQLKLHPQIKQTLYNKSLSEIAKLLGIEMSNPEGWLFPDTYAFTAGTSDLTLLKIAYKNMRIQLDKLWEERQQPLPYKTPYQALIMASIIEKESSYIAEQPMISSVFVNRLKKRMRLQTDPTVIYGLGERYKGDITRAHLREKTAYNTYRINGLPPTPIAMAGLSALRATLNPVSSNNLYFVSDGNGKHVFSQNLAAHNRAVRAYLNMNKSN